MDPQEEEQRRIDEEARRAADEAESRALEQLAGADLTGAATGAASSEPATHRVELAPDPDLDNVPTSSEPEQAPGAPEEPDAFPDSDDGDAGSGSQSVDYGRAGMDQMMRALHYRDDEPAHALAQPQGIIEQGNIDLHDRPVVQNDDGSYSTLRSMSFGTDRGETLVPTVSDDGRIMSDDEAEAEFRRTGHHLGIFATPGTADDFAEQIHNSGDAEYGDRVRADPSLTRTGPAEEAAPTDDPEGIALERLVSDGPDASPADPTPTAPSPSPASPSEELALSQMEQQPTAPRGPSAFERWSAAPSPIADRASALASPIAPSSVAAKPTGSPEDAPGPRLDDGLPSEREIASARDNPFTSFLHHLQNGLRGALGRPAHDYDARGDALAQERRTGLTQRMAAKATDRRADAAASSTAARQAQQDELARAGLALRERSVAAQEEMTPARVAQVQAQTDQTRAQTRHVVTADEIAAGSRADRESATSALSRGAQYGVQARLSLLPESRQRAITEALGGRDISTMSAAELEPVLRSITQGVGIRGSGGTGGGTVAPGASGATLAEQYVRHGVAGASTIPEAQAMIDALGGDDSARAQAILQSRVNEESAATTGPTTQAAVAAVSGSLTEVQTRLRSYRGGDIPGVGLIDGNVPYTALSPEGREMRQLIRDLSDNYLRMVSGAAVPEHEIEQFAARLGATDETQFPAAIARLERELERRRLGTTAPTASASTDRVRARAPRTAPSAGTTSRGTPPISGALWMRFPGGREGWVRPDLIDEAAGHGAFEVPRG